MIRNLCGRKSIIFISSYATADLEDDWGNNNLCMFSYIILCFNHVFTKSGFKFEDEEKSNWFQRPNACEENMIIEMIV